MSVELLSALGSLKTFVPLAQGTISAPVTHVDLALPAGYDEFELRVQNLNSGNSTLAAAIGISGTLLNDITNFDTYSQIFNEKTSSAIFVSTYNAGADALMDLGNLFPAVSQAILRIYPGAAGVHPLVSCDYMGFDVAGVRFAQRHSENWLNQAAVVPPTLARINTLRLQPYGDGSVGQTAANFTAGSYHLFGIPTP